MARKVIYHGSSLIVKQPEFNFKSSNPHNDYGLGFYCTCDIKLAKEWACKNQVSGYLNKYSLNDDNLKILDLTDKTKYSVLNWIAVLFHFRNLKKSFLQSYFNEIEFLNKYYIDIAEYDIVIGFRADDANFKFPVMFIKGEISIKCLEEIYFLGDLGKQYVLISEKAFKRIKFIDYDAINEKYKFLYQERMDKANKQLDVKVSSDDRIYNKTIIDLIRETKNDCK